PPARRARVGGRRTTCAARLVGAGSTSRKHRVGRRLAGGTETSTLRTLAFASPMPASSLDTVSINTIRFLSADAVQKANSGHPGLPMGAAAMAYALWTRFL